MTGKRSNIFKGLNEKKLFSGRQSNDINVGKGIKELDAVLDESVRDFQKGKGPSFDI